MITAKIAKQLADENKNPAKTAEQVIAMLNSMILNKVDNGRHHILLHLPYIQPEQIPDIKSYYENLGYKINYYSGRHELTITWY